nr:twin-arginine translocation protein TatB [uncultured Gammaproteobacteria bacterium]
MFEIGFWELVLVGIVALLVLGPERLPGAVRTTVFVVRRARSLVAQVKADIERELALEEVKASLEQGDSLKHLRDLEQKLRQPLIPPQTVEQAGAQPKAAVVDDDSA